MKFELDCIACIVGQAVTVPRRFTDNHIVQDEILKKTLIALAQFPRDRTPPEMGGAMNQIVSQCLGVSDPYYDEKRRLNAHALALLPALRQMVSQADDPFEAACRMAIAGNVIDFGAPGGQTDGDLMGCFEEALYRPIHSNVVDGFKLLKQKAHAAKDILYLADNCGEIVLDRLLIEQLPKEKVTVVVRSGPAINDALLEDAEEVGLDEVATVIESSVALPGTPLKRVSEAFKKRFEQADCIISKGQGNYETLSEETAPIFFLLMAKCALVKKHLGCELGDYVLHMGDKDLEF